MSKKNVTSSNILCWKILCALDFTQRERETHIGVYHVIKAFQRNLKEIYKISTITVPVMFFTTFSLHTVLISTHQANGSS